MKILLKDFFHPFYAALIGSAVAFGLQACGIAPPPPNPTPLPIVQPKETVVIPPSLLTPCDPVKHIPVQKYTQKQTLGPTKVWQDQYTACSNKQRALSKLAADAFNINTAPASAAVAASAPQ